MKLSILLISLFSFAAISKDFKPNMEELKLNKIKETKKSYSAGESIPYKRASNASRLSNIEFKGVTNTNREQNLKRYIQLNKEESEDSTTLKLSLNYLEPKLKDPNKYRIKSVNYHFGDGNIQNTTITNINGEDFIILDISSLSVGSYTASIELVIQKNEDLRAKGNKNKSGSDFKPILLTYSVEFEKVDSAFLVVNEYLRPEGLWAIGLDLSESYSEGGEILNYKVETFFEGELEFSATITFNRFSISFFDVGEWKIVITMTDSLGDTDTKELIYNVTNARPRLEYTYSFSEEFQGAIDIDMSASSDDGGEIVEYATFFLNDGQFSNYLVHGPKVTRSLLRSGINRVCFRVVDNTGVDRVSCTNIEYNGPINPFFTLIDIIPTDIIDPRLYVVEDSCTVPEGRSVGEYIYNYDNGELFLELRTQDEFFDIFFPEPGVWNIEAFCTDDLGNKSNVVNLEFNADFELIKPDAFVELVRLEDDITGLTYAVSNEDSIPSPYSDFIAEFIYQGKNLDTGETFSYNFDFPFNDVVFPSYGNWEITYTVIDGTGIKSEPYFFNINVERPRIKPIANIVIERNEGDTSGLGYFVKDEASQPGSSNIISYNFNFTNSGTGESFILSPGQPFIFFSFPNVGQWVLNYTVTNEQNLTSDPLILTINVQNELPVADFDIIAIDRFTYQFTSSSTDDIEVIGSAIEFNGVSQVYDSNTFTVTFSEPGTYSINLFAIDNFNQRSVAQIESIFISEQEIDGDGVPPMPDKTRNNSTLTGIDVDKDGVRDDVEIFINNLFTNNSDLRKSYKNFSKLYNLLLINVDNKTEVLRIDPLLSKASFCANYMDNVNTDAIKRENLMKLKSLLINTSARVFADIKLNGYYGGRSYTIPSDIDNYCIETTNK